MTIDYKDIGRRLHAHRLGKGQAAEDIADMLGMSRAAVYRIESGDVVKIDTLDKLATLLGVSMASLLGVGVEYYANAVSYFERMRQFEETSNQVIAHFPPMSYLLTSDAYSSYLRKTLIESLPRNLADRTRAKADVDRVIAILDERKDARRRRNLSVVNFVSVPELERWLKLGVVGRFDHAADEVTARRRAARSEVEHLGALIESAPMGIQIALIDETLPNMTFQLFRRDGGTTLGLSPYRLGGDLPNIRSGIAMMTEDIEPVRLHEDIANELWSRARKGRDAVSTLQTILNRSGVSKANIRVAS